MGDGHPVKVLKLQTPEGVQVEIYNSPEGAGSSLIDRIRLQDRHNGFFDFQGEASQLAILDVNGDGLYEIIAPTFDERLNAHLNIFRYNPEVRRFEAFQPASK